MFPGVVGARTAFRTPAASRLSDVSRRRTERERSFNREADDNAIRTQLTFAKECFGWRVVTSDPLLTSAKWVAYGTEVGVGKLHDIVYQGRCTGSDRSIFSLADILWGSGNADVSSPLVWLFLLLLDHSIKTHSSSGSGRGRLPHTIFSAEL